MAVTTNIGSRAHTRRSYDQIGRQPEHPRASTTDDVECFFSVLRDNLGSLDFTVKRVLYQWRKVCIEFTK